MKERPIRLCPHEVRAVRAGRQTQFRRALKPQPPPPYNWCRVKTVGKWHHIEADTPDTVMFTVSDFEAGQKLWVRESFQLDEVWNDCSIKNVPNDEVVFYPEDESSTGVVPFGWGRVRPSIHMPRWASRITLEVVNVRVERLQEITEADAMAEGIEPDRCHKCGYTAQDCWEQMDHKLCGQPAPISAKGDFRTLWTSINGPGSWEKNLFVWVVEFKI